jgi:PKHD-type hydroxylase
VTLCLQGVVTPPEREAAGKVIGAASFAPGRATAIGGARDRKDNLQLERARCAEIGRIDRMLVDALCRDPEFNRTTLVRRFAQFLYARYEPGMRYGPHVDAGIFGSGTTDPMRSDLAVTIFLSDLTDYDGGELVLDTPLGMYSVKLPAGDVVVYPATTLHEVRPVTRGVRLVAVTWVQSWVRDLLAREILADISRAADVLRRKGSSDEESLLLSRAYANLLRREADG